jgi:hypothetical protein
MGGQMSEIKRYNFNLDLNCDCECDMIENKNGKYLKVDSLPELARLAAEAFIEESLGEYKGGEEEFTKMILKKWGIE